MVDVSWVFRIITIFVLGISATTWLAGQGYDFTDYYPVLVHSELMEYMGLSKYLLEEECSVTGDRYDGNLNGWVQGKSLLYIHYECIKFDMETFGYVNIAPVQISVYFIYVWR